MRFSNYFLYFFIQFLLWLRYSVAKIGLKDVQKRGKEGILFLPSHPSLIDTVILMTTLFPRYNPKIVADQNSVDYPIIGKLAKRFGAVTMPTVTKNGPGEWEKIDEVLNSCADGLKRGENWVLYPAGHILTDNYEKVGGNSAVKRILDKVPTARVVLVRTRGIWGSSLSVAFTGKYPKVSEVAKKSVKDIFKSLIFFLPRRKVTMEFVEAADFPRTEEKMIINRYIEAFYNQAPLPQNTYYSYSIFGSRKPKTRPEPLSYDKIPLDLKRVSDETRHAVYVKLTELSGISSIDDEMNLAADLGLDSLLRAELISWMADTFSVQQTNPDSLYRVGELLLAASGEAIADNEHVTKKAMPDAWKISKIKHNTNSVENLHDPTISAAFLRMAKKYPHHPIMADHSLKVMTYKQIVLYIMSFMPTIKKREGKYIGVMLPASIPSVILLFSVIFSGKIPVMINWTQGARNLKYACDLLNISTIFTSKALLNNLAEQKTDLSSIEDKLLNLEDVRDNMPTKDKLLALVRSNLSWGSLKRAKIEETAVVLFTSGSESNPKAVPLTHKNLMNNVTTVLSRVAIRTDDSMMSFLPPFHSFGLTANILITILTGTKALFYPAPTEAVAIAKLIQTWKITTLIGTPTFLRGIAGASSGDMLSTLRVVVSGAESCSLEVLDSYARLAPNASVIEGYGITETSPIVSVSALGKNKQGSVGDILSSFKFKVVSVNDLTQEVKTGEQGILLLSGESVFGGYLGDARDPFIEFDGEKMYNTGDIVSVDAENYLTIHGRLKRFVKIGGEMISLPLIESTLTEAFTREGDALSIAVIAKEDVDNRPEIILFTTIADLTREQANNALKSAHLSPLHNIRQVKVIAEIPVLGTGKTDFQNLILQS